MTQATQRSLFLGPCHHPCWVTQGSANQCRPAGRWWNA